MGVFLPIVVGGNAEPAPGGYEQLVNYNIIEFSSKQAEWTEKGGTFEFTEEGLYQAAGGTKGTDTTRASHVSKILSIPVNITKESFKMFVSHIMNTTANNQVGIMSVFLCSKGVPIIQFERADNWGGSANQECRLYKNPSFAGSGSTDAFVSVTASASLNNMARTDEVHYDGTTFKGSLDGTKGSYATALNENIDEIQIWYCGTSSSSYAIAGMLVSGMQIFNHDDFYTLCYKAGVASKPLDELLTDTTSLTAIFTNEDAVNFMVAQCTGDFMVGVLNSADAVALLKASPYINTVIGNPHWAKFMMMIPTAQELLGFMMVYDASLGNADSNECKEVTGGWVKKTGTTITKNSDSIYMSSADMANSTLVDLSGFSKFLFKHKLVSKASTYGRMQYILKNSSNTEVSRHMYYYDSGTGAPSANQTIDEKTGTTLITSVKDIFDVAKIPVYIWVDSAYAASYLYEIGVFKPDNWQTWASLGGISATDLNTLLADSTKMATLMSNEEACRYMVGCTGDLMVSICNSEVAMNALVNNISYEYAFRHPVWYKFMTMIPTALSAMDSVAVTVPTMTSDTTPSGETVNSGISPDYASEGQAYKAFDKDTGTRWTGLTDDSPYIGYIFEEPIECYRVEMYSDGQLSRIGSCTLKCGSDMSDLVEVADLSFAGKPLDYVLPKPIIAKCWVLGDCVRGDAKTSSTISCHELNFYGKAVN